MSRILVYSHDTYGLGNIRRMLSIATHLAGTLENASVLMVSGSPMLQGFRIAPGVDYMKLPSVTRTARDGYSSRSLHLDAVDVFELRANIVLAAVADFRPDAILVDKKPFGIEHELEGAIYYAKTNLPRTSLVLVLRDILDERAATIQSWRAGNYTSAIDRFYDRVLVLGTPGVFDACREYDLPASVREKMRFCGYLRRPLSARRRDDVRRDLGVEPGGRLVLVTPGGGQDGDRVLSTYADALPAIHAGGGVRSLIVTGPEMDVAGRRSIERATATVSGVEVREFTDDMMSCIDAADVVVCMAGYNTVCEVATLRKRAVVIPRVRPVAEQRVRAERLARLGVVKAVYPDGLDGARLAAAVLSELAAADPAPPGELDLGGLPRVTRHVAALLRRQRSLATTHRLGSGLPPIAAAVNPFARPRIA